MALATPRLIYSQADMSRSASQRSGGAPLLDAVDIRALGLRVCAADCKIASGYRVVASLAARNLLHRVATSPGALCPCGVQISLPPALVL